MYLLSIGLSVLFLPAALAVDYPVAVGAGGQLKFDPETATASPGRLQSRSHETTFLMPTMS